MPEYDLDEEELSNLVDFLLAQAEKGKEIDPELKETGEMLLEENGCYNCHAYDGIGGDTAPVLDNFASDQWLRSIIEDPGQKEYFGQLNAMPAFKDKLSKQEIDNIVYFLQYKRKNPIKN
jgi:mono/diheme cytochrome c family protein